MKTKPFFEEKSTRQVVIILSAVAFCAFKAKDYDPVQPMLSGIDVLDPEHVQANVLKWALAAEFSVEAGRESAEWLLSVHPNHAVCQAIALAARFRQNRPDYRDLMASVIKSPECDMGLAMTGLDQDVAFQSELRKFRSSKQSATATTADSQATVAPPPARRILKFV